jgi:hypothetical protein
MTTTSKGSAVLQKAQEVAKKGKAGTTVTPEGILNYALAKAGAEVRPLVAGNSEGYLRGDLFTIDPRRLRGFEERR